MKTRMFFLLKAGSVIVILGSMYILFVKVTGWGIPCPIYQITGLLCPGCGITRMVLSLLSGDIRSAFYYNAGIMLAMPCLIFLGVSAAYRYVRNGEKKTLAYETVIQVLLIAWLLVFGVFRNFKGGIG